MYGNNSSLDAKLKSQQKWNQINWVKVEKFVLRLERSIAKAVEHHCHDNFERETKACFSSCDFLDKHFERRIK